MTEEKFYPIYRFGIEFEESEYNTNMDKMFATRLNPEAQKQVLDSWVEGYRASKQPGPEGEELPVAELGLTEVVRNIRLRETETWCGGWFSHWTLNTHLSDEELRASFRRYVNRKRPYNVGFAEDWDYYKSQVPEHLRVCLMGAEDTWRWKGPCHCDKCQALGITRIDH